MKNAFNKKHSTHKETLFKFLLLVALLIGYLCYMSWKFDASTGLGLSLLTWSFFVLCTPVADGGFIVAFPLRLLFGVRMAITQVALWVIAIFTNVMMLWISPSTYDLTFVTGLLKKILLEPYPYWSILLISAVGTFLSIYFGDEMMDVTSHKERSLHHKHAFKHKVIATLGLGLLAVFAYYKLLSGLGITIPK